MAKPSVSYVCQQCGGAHRKWNQLYIHFQQGVLLTLPMVKK